MAKAFVLKFPMKRILFPLCASLVFLTVFQRLGVYALPLSCRFFLHDPLDLSCQGDVSLPLKVVFLIYFVYLR